MTAILAPARKFAEGEIESLAESLSIATQTSAILVARTDSGQHEIICGNARFAAAQALNWREIDAVVVEGDEDARKLMRIADNLHRRKMTKLDRARQIDLWCQLACEVSQVDTPGGQQPHERGLAKAKGKLGISKSDAARCRTIARLTPPAATTAVYLKLANNGRALLSAAVCATEEEQMACLRAFAEQKNNAKTNRRSMKRSAGTGPEVPAAASGAGVEHSVPQSTRQLDAELQIPPILDRRNPDVHFDRLLRLWRDFRSQLDNAPEAARDRFVRETLTAEDPLLKRLLPSCAQTGAEV
jgi:ParB-like nuclease domain